MKRDSVSVPVGQVVIGGALGTASGLIALAKEKVAVAGAAGGREKVAACIEVALIVQEAY